MRLWPAAASALAGVKIYLTRTAEVVDGEWKELDGGQIVDVKREDLREYNPETHIQSLEGAREGGRDFLRGTIMALSVWLSSCSSMDVYGCAWDMRCCCWRCLFWDAPDGAVRDRWVDGPARLPPVRSAMEKTDAAVIVERPGRVEKGLAVVVLGFLGFLGLGPGKPRCSLPTISL